MLQARPKDGRLFFVPRSSRYEVWTAVCFDRWHRSSLLYLEPSFRANNNILNETPSVIINPVLEVNIKRKEKKKPCITNPSVVVPPFPVNNLGFDRRCKWKRGMRVNRRNDGTHMPSPPQCGRHRNIERNPPWPMWWMLEFEGKQWGGAHIWSWSLPFSLIYVRAQYSLFYSFILLFFCMCWLMKFKV